MKREFLQNIQVNGAQLPKEIIDSIMEEHGRGITAEKAKYSDYDTVKSQLAEAQKTITGLQQSGTTIEAAQKAAQEWESKYNAAVQKHAQEIADRDFSDKLTAGITKAKGKNAKAITALLDLDTLKASKNQDKDIEAAITACAAENAYLFGEDQKAPPYAAGTGKSGSGKQSYTNEQLSAMSYEEYRQYRAGK